MARGRGGYSESVLPPRRKPVRIEDVDHMYTGARKAARISDFANEDSEDLSRRSHLKDRKLLDDITTKLVNSAYHEPVRVHRTGARRPPVAPLGRKPVVTAAPRRVGVRTVPSMFSSYRASSVPPRYVEEEVVTPYNFYEVAAPRNNYHHHYYTPPSVNYQPRSYGAATRAHSEPPPLTRSSSLAVKNARRCLDRIERELGVDDGDLYSTGPAVRVTREPVVRARTAARSAAGAGGVVRRRPGSQPAPASRSRISQAEIELEVEDYLEQPFIRPSVRTRASSLDRSSSRLPPPPAVSPSLVRSRAGSYGSLAASLERMPALDPYRPSMASVGSGGGYGSGSSGGGGGGYGTAITPYIPARVSRTNAGGLPPKAPAYVRPEMSDTRKRIRDVICHTRRDPHYYS